MTNYKNSQQTRVACFSYFFNKNLFEPSADSKIMSDEFLTKRTVATLLNEIFLTNKEELPIFARNNL